MEFFNFKVNGQQIKNKLIFVIWISLHSVIEGRRNGPDDIACLQEEHFWIRSHFETTFFCN